MKKGLRKRLILTATLCGLFALFIMLPVSFGYGTSFNNATEISNGITNEVMLSDYIVYYKICCSAGDTLSVNLTDYGGSYDLDLAIISPDMTTVLDYSNTAGDEYCTTSCSSLGWYYIRVHNFAQIVPSTITLTVAGATGSGCPVGIPGFELISTLIGLIAATFLAVILLKGRTQILN